MNKIINKLTVVTLASLLAVIAVFSCFAETVYEYYGLKYTIINNFSVGICGCNDNVSELSFPNKIEDRTVTDIVARAYKENTNIVSVSFSKARGLTYIGMFAFKDCSNLGGEINLPENITSIQTGAFENCSSLGTVKYNANTKSVPKQCFNKCSSLSSVELNNSVEEICGYAFAGCTSLSEITIPKSVTAIDSTAFDNDDDIVIQCYRDSYAEQFAKENNIEFELLDPILGDANFDGSFDIRDVTAIQKYKAGLTKLTKTGIRAADVTGDGEVSVRDATQIQRYLANIITDF